MGEIYSLSPLLRKTVRIHVKYCSGKPRSGIQTGNVAIKLRALSRLIDSRRSKQHRNRAPPGSKTHAEFCYFDRCAEKPLQFKRNIGRGNHEVEIRLASRPYNRLCYVAPRRRAFLLRITKSISPVSRPAKNYPHLICMGQHLDPSAPVAKSPSFPITETCSGRALLLELRKSRTRSC